MATEDIMDVQAKGEPTAAENVLLAAQQINNLSQLFMFIKSAGLGTRAETGIIMQVELMDPQRTKLFINSKLLLPALMEEFQKTGDSLEANNISLKNLLEGLEDRFKKIYTSVNPL